MPTPNLIPYLILVLAAALFLYAMLKPPTTGEK
ncbi:hypothetical protein GGR26_000458 [Lewinella marina]|nr:hypothetical protein [Neolewinella marina]